MRHEELLGCKVAGRFMIKRLLGEGGMASVYVAERDPEPREVALKIMDPALTSDRSFVRRFQREAKAASRVKHPNSVKIFEYGVEGRLSYIVMELLVGADLYALLEREGALSQRRVVRLLAEVCEALMVAHDMGIVHRDLKPENIMVIPDPAHLHGERVKVLDFGIAKVLEADTTGESEEGRDARLDPTSALTRVGTLIGTPAYMSPEQCGLLPVDTRADIYACGVLLYQLVTGRLPFEGETPLHTATLHIHSPVPVPSAVSPAIDRRLEALIMKALAKKPSDRFQTARHLGASLLKLLPDLPDAPVGTGPTSKRQISSMWPREGPRSTPSLPDRSLESAQTLTSGLEVGPPPSVKLNRPPARPPLPSAPRQVPPYIPLELPTPDSDGEFSTVTLVRPEPQGREGPAASRTPEWPLPSEVEDRDSSPAMIRDVNATLRSAEDFGRLRSERRPEVHVPVSSSPLAREALASSPHDLRREPLDSSAYGAPQEGAPWRQVHTIRMPQHSSPGAGPAPASSPSPPRPGLMSDADMAAFSAAAKVQPPAPILPYAAGIAPTLPIPPQPARPEVAVFPPTLNNLPQIPTAMPYLIRPPKHSVLSGKIGLLIGFLTGMLITAALVALYLFLTR